MSHLLIVDDNQNFVNTLAKVLKRAEYETTVVYDGYAALHQVEHNPHIDLVLLDLDLKDSTLNGRDVCHRIRKLPQPPLVIMLTVSGSRENVLEGLECANDFISKALDEKILDEEILLAKIKAILRTREDVSKKQLVIDDRLTIDAEKRTVYVEDQKIDLTPREYDLLYFMATHRGQVFGRQKLLDAVWGIDDDGINDRTVDRHISILRKKLEKNPYGSHYILTVHSFGYQFYD